MHAARSSPSFSLIFFCFVLRSSLWNLRSYCYRRWLGWVCILSSGPKSPYILLCNASTRAALALVQKGCSFLWGNDERGMRKHFQIFALPVSSEKHMREQARFHDHGSLAQTTIHLWHQQQSNVGVVGFSETSLPVAAAKTQKNIATLGSRSCQIPCIPPMETHSAQHACFELWNSWSQTLEGHLPGKTIWGSKRPVSNKLAFDCQYPPGSLGRLLKEKHHLNYIPLSQ